MRRLAGFLVLGAALVGVVAFGSAAGGSEGSYLVRAIFDNGSFLVPGEEVRIAGARVGQVDEVDVTGTDEAAHEDGSPEPGKAVVVLSIDDPAFQDFRTDAECLIRPQSLLGEKFVECRQTQPRAAGTQPPPELEVIPEGEPGEGQRLLPLERNGKTVDLDLVNNIMREPYPDRFRLILNDLGAGLAARGEDLEAVVERSNPALRRTNEVLAILARQNRRLAELARDGDRVLGPLAAQRERISGFINNATTAATATAERRADLEAGLQKLPGFLRELRATMIELDRFAVESTPVVSDLGDAAPDLTRITEALGPFSDSSTGALRSLGDAADRAGPALDDSQGVIRRIRDVADSSRPTARDLAGLLASLRRNEGFRNLMTTFFLAAGSVNPYDEFGHFGRLLLPVNNCFDYRAAIGDPACVSFFSASGARRAANFERALQDEALAAIYGRDQGDDTASRRDERERPASGPEPDAGPSSPAPDGTPEAAPDDVAPEDGAEDEPLAEPAPAGVRDARMLLDLFVGDGTEGASR